MKHFFKIYHERVREKLSAHQNNIIQEINRLRDTPDIPDIPDTIDPLAKVKDLQVCMSNIIDAPRHVKQITKEVLKKPLFFSACSGAFVAAAICVSAGVFLVPAAIIPVTVLTFAASVAGYFGGEKLASYAFNKYIYKKEKALFDRYDKALKEVEDLSVATMKVVVPNIDAASECYFFIKKLSVLSGHFAMAIDRAHLEKRVERADHNRALRN